MKEIIDTTNVNEIQKYIEEKENSKLILKSTHTKECLKRGHKPHYDTGDGNHMLYTRYSASTLVSKDYKGGEFVFVDEDDNEIESINQETHYNKTLIFDVSHKHKVNPHYDGKRIVNLYFWATEEPTPLPECVERYVQQIKEKKTETLKQCKKNMKC